MKSLFFHAIHFNILNVDVTVSVTVLEPTQLFTQKSVNIH